MQDSYAHHYRAFRATFAHYGIHLDETDYRAAYSPNWLRTYRQLGLPEEHWEAADQLWLQEAAKGVPPLFPGVAETLQSLNHARRLGVVTAGGKERVYYELTHNGLLGYFQSIVTGDDVARRKPAPDGLLQALAELGVPPAQAVYVGDTHLDYETARAADMDFIGIPSLFGALPVDTPCLQVAAFPDLLQLFRMFD